MPKWTDYTKKTSPENNDEVMILDTAGKANKRLNLSILSDWILNKIADKVFQKLETNSKTVLGAINELNSKTLNEKTVDYSTVNIPESGYVLLNALPEGIPEELKIRQVAIATYKSILPASSFNMYVNVASKKAYVFGNPNTVISNLSVRFYYTA